jgi:hypothetical protein
MMMPLKVRRSTTAAPATLPSARREAPAPAGGTTGRSADGRVNRIKKIKRQLYGRAGLHLLRKLILLQ